MRSDMESMHQHTSSPGPPQQSSYPSHDPLTGPQPVVLPETSMHTAASSHMHGTSLVPLHQQQHQQYQQQQQHLIANADVVRLSQQQTIERLQQQLHDAQQASQDIAAENERLMELSSALRSERDRAVMSQGNVSMAQPAPTPHVQSQQLAIAATSQPQHLPFAHAAPHQQQVPVLLPPPLPLQAVTSHPPQKGYLRNAYVVQPQQQHLQQQLPGWQHHAGGCAYIDNWVMNE